MLHLDYIGLLNTDHQRKGPVQMFLQGRESRARYVLDTLPSWIADMLGHAPERTVERHSISGANLALCNQETREALYRSLVEGGYKVRQIGVRESIRRSVRSLCPEPPRLRSTMTASTQHETSLPPADRGGFLISAMMRATSASQTDWGVLKRFPDAEPVLTSHSLWSERGVSPQASDLHHYCLKLTASLSYRDTCQELPTLIQQCLPAPRDHAQETNAKPNDKQ